jgi:hypothetical protein
VQVCMYETLWATKYICLHSSVRVCMCPSVQVYTYTVVCTRCLCLCKYVGIHLFMYACACLYKYVPMKPSLQVYLSRSVHVCECADVCTSMIVPVCTSNYGFICTIIHVPVYTSMHMNSCIYKYVCLRQSVQVCKLIIWKMLFFTWISTEQWQVLIKTMKIKNIYVLYGDYITWADTEKPDKIN